MDTNSRRLLLVDDDPQVLNVLGEMLSSRGYNVFAVEDGTKALDLIETQIFDLILTDMKMPSISGLDIARKAKQVTPNTPVIMVTGWSGEIGEMDLSASEIDLLLQKPVALKELAGAVAKLLSARR